MSSLQPQNPWKILSSRDIYNNPWISLTEHQVLNPRGGEGIYGVVHFKNFALGVLALDDELNIFLVGQYRFPIKAYSWEIPEGGGSFDVTPLEGAMRELLEETGLKADNWEELQVMHLSNSVSDEVAVLFLATDLHQYEASPEDTEELELKKVHITEACQMVEDGEITDAMSVAGILRLRILLVKRRILLI